MLNELWILLIVASLVIVPKILLRYGLPEPLTAFILGLMPMMFGYELLGNENLNLLAILGITSLFLHAGTEVNVRHLIKEKQHIIVHLCIKVVILMGLAILLIHLYPINFGIGLLLVLAIMTPSTGFIVNTLPRLHLSADESFWVTNKAISSEIVALLMMFIALQLVYPDIAPVNVGLNVLALTGLIVILPIVFSFLGKVVIPYAPGSEFSLLIVMGILAGYATKLLGVYYLVGAFLVGLIAVMLKHKLPTMSSLKNIKAIGLFTGFFIPFYFFISGSRFPEEALTLEAILFGFLLLVIVVPVRWLVIWSQRRLLHDESQISSFRITIALTPTLIFTLVIAEILFNEELIHANVYGGLMAYAVLNTILPTIFFALFKLKNEEKIYEYGNN
jgi:Kef-type K+ transport system membrane component KefB